jgi:hypothetical protein
MKSSNPPFGIGELTELDQARAHLRECQDALHLSRSRGVNSFGVPFAKVHDGLRREHNALYAAISWVWDAQEREREQRQEWLDRFPCAGNLRLIKRGLFLQHFNIGDSVSFEDGTMGRIVA